MRQEIVVLVNITSRMILQENGPVDAQTVKTTELRQSTTIHAMNTKKENSNPLIHNGGESVGNEKREVRLQIH